MVLKLLLVAVIGTGLASWAVGDLWNGWFARAHGVIGFAVIALLIRHLVTRPMRARVADLDRRALLRTGVVAGAALGLYLVQETLTRATGLAGGRRRATGSHDVGLRRKTLAVIMHDGNAPSAQGEPARRRRRSYRA